MRMTTVQLAMVSVFVLGFAGLASAGEQPDVIRGVDYCSNPQTGTEGTRRALARAACDLAAEAAGYEHGVLRPCTQDEAECQAFQCESPAAGVEPRKYICYGVGR